jgi:hypothetical protein
MKLLNLDELVTVERYVTLRGVRYAVAERTIGVLVAGLQAAQAQEAAGEVNQAKFFEDLIKTLRSILPELPEEVASSLSMEQAVAIINFASQDPKTLADAVSQEAPAEGEAEVKKA